MTKIPGAIAAATIAGLVMTALADDDLPKQAAFARYEPMMNRSPFAVATAPAALPAATPNFAKDLYVANVARTSEGDLVTIASSTDKNFKKYLTTKEPMEGFSVPNIEWSDRIGGTKVTISKDGQFATLTFNQALLSQPLANSPPQPQQVTPQIVAPVPQNMNPNVIKPAPIPAVPTPPPRIRGVIPRNPQRLATPPAPVPQVQPDSEIEPDVN